MRICISSAGLDWRGTETVAVDLMRGLRERGHEVVLFGRAGSALSKHHEVVPVLGAVDMNPFIIGRTMLALKKLRIDVVLIMKDKDLRQTGLAAHLLGIPVVVLHGTDRPLKNKLRYKFFFKKVATHHVANSEATRNGIYKSAPWMKDEKIAVIYNGIDVKKFANRLTAEPPDRLTAKEGLIAVGFVGHFEMRKGIMDFAEAWKLAAPRIPNAEAVIVGRGGEEEKFRKALEGTPRVNFVGFRKDIENVYKELDIFVMPSHFEGFGLVLVEAMAAGCACAAYNTSSLPEIVRDNETGLLVPPNPRALADAIVKLSVDAELRNRLAQNATTEVRERFSVDAMVDGYERLLSEIIPSSRTALS